MRPFSKKKILLALLTANLFAISGCALLGGGDEDVGTKNSKIVYEQPETPFEEVSVGSADKIWQSKKTGNTIAINSLCKKYESMNLENLKRNIMDGFDHLKIEKTENLTFNGREAQRIQASGDTEGVPIKINLLILKKDNCTYDIAYVARSKTFDKEMPLFENFIKGFQVP